jgi:vacuole membrane protein 1
MYEQLTVAALRVELGKRGLSKTGLKASLVERLNAATREENASSNAQTPMRGRGSGKTKQTTSRKALSPTPSTAKKDKTPSRTAMTSPSPARGRKSSVKPHASAVRRRNISPSPIAPSPIERPKLARISPSLRKHDKSKVKNEDDDEFAVSVERIRTTVTLTKSPFRVVWLFCLAAFYYTKDLILWGWNHKAICLMFFAILLSLYLADRMPGEHQPFFMTAKKVTYFSSYWILLGFLSSAGLGTGLHTFLLYLGPHIAHVTLAADECRTLAFKQLWDVHVDAHCEMSSSAPEELSLFSVYTAVVLEATLWGLGTAIGELPPYFVARAARLAGKQSKEMAEELNEATWNGRAKKALTAAVEKGGFLGILLFASVPNPLFDLAGLTCGHCLVPFFTFFLATAIGKGVFKASGQALFTITLFRERTLQQVLATLGRLLPTTWFAALLAGLEKEKSKYHPATAGMATGAGGKSWFSTTFDMVLALFILYFLLSIVVSIAQEYMISEERKKQQSSASMASNDQAQSSANGKKRKLDSAAE